MPGHDAGSETATTLPRVGPDRPLEAELRALIEVSSAVAAAHRFDDVLDAVGRQACAVLCAASISISRFEPEDDWMRVLANAGELHPGEDPRPAQETWPLSPLDRRLVERCEPYVVSLTEPGLPAAERDFLERIERGSVLACPIRFGDSVWGVLEAYSAVGTPAFSSAHVRFAEALCAQVATAIGRSELFSRLEKLAYEDPLTRLPNRRALDVRLEEAVARAVASDGELALLFCDLDALKEVNDRDGHAAGDRALAATGAALAETAEDYPGSFTSRLGGDEFCVLMEGHGADAAQALARAAGERLAAAPGGPFAFSCGVAVLDAEHRHSGDLFRAADAAQYAAKRVGGGSVFVAEPGHAEPAVEPASRRRFRDARPDDRAALVRDLLAQLDGPLAAASAGDRLEAVAIGFAVAFDAAKWAISYRAPGAATVATTRSAERRGVRIRVQDESYALADFPQTAAVLARGGGFALAADDAAADPGERALLDGWGFTAVTAAAAIGPDGAGRLLELFADRHTHPGLTAALPDLRLLTAEAVARAQPATSEANSAKTST